MCVIRKEELLGILDYASGNGSWKSENCKHKDKDSYCTKWKWSSELTYWEAKCPWLEVRNIKGEWYAKASPNACALCGSFEQKGSEMGRLRMKVKELEDGLMGIKVQIYDLDYLSSAYKANGDWEKRHCSHYDEGYCHNWQWGSKRISPT